jgi:hypothetical protein
MGLNNNPESLPIVPALQVHQADVRLSLHSRCINLYGLVQHIRIVFGQIACLEATPIKDRLRIIVGHAQAIRLFQVCKGVEGFVKMSLLL